MNATALRLGSWPVVGRAVVAAVACLLVAAAPARAQSYFRASASAQNGSGSTTLTINVPSGTVAGDVMVAAIGDASGSAPTTPSGWTVVPNASVTGTGSYTTYYRVAGASEPASYTWTLAGSAVKGAGEISSFVGVDNTSPIVAAANSVGGSVTSASAPSVTTSAANTLVVTSVGYSSGSVPTVTVPAGTTQRTSTVTSGSATYYGGVTTDFTQASAGATPSKTFTFSSSVSTYAAVQIALKPATGVLAFGVAPALPTLPGVTLNGQAQTVTAAMTSFDVDDTTGSGSGWNVTVAGDATTGHSAVFKQYCPNATCGTDSGPGYVAGGRTLPAGSLTLNTTGASFTGGSGTAPTLQCGSGCAVDAASATKVASAATSAGAGPWATTGFGASSLSLAVPTTLRTLQAGETYRVNVIWTLNSGP